MKGKPVLGRALRVVFKVIIRTYFFPTVSRYGWRIRASARDHSRFEAPQLPPVPCRTTAERNRHLGAVGGAELAGIQAHRLDGHARPGRVCGANSLPALAHRW